MANEDNVNQIEKLCDEKNFMMWKFQIGVMFKANDLFDLINGKSKLDNLSDQKEILAWLKKDAKAQKLIVLSVNNKNTIHIMSCETAFAMYEKLCKIYEKDDSQQKCKILQDFFGVTFERGTDLASHISKIENLAHRLNSLKTEISDEMIMSKILSTLPDAYKHFVSAWDSTSADDKTLTNMISRLISEEQRNVSAESNPMVAFKTNEQKCYKCKNSGHLARNCKKNMKCFKCNQIGHFANECSKNKNRDSNSNKNKTINKKCSICRKTNHDENECYFRDKNKVSFLTSNNVNIKCDEWVLDSGSSSHMTNDRSSLSDISEINCDIFVAKANETMRAEIKGKIETDKCVLKDVLYVPELTKNLLSVHAITQNGGVVNFKNEKVEIFKNNIKILDGELNANGLYLVNLKLFKNSALVSENKTNKVKEWHSKIGHISDENFKKLLNISDGIKFSNKDYEEYEKLCEICINAKQTRKPFKNNRSKATRPLEIVHTDICGPIDPETWDNKRYYISFIDDYTHFVKVFLLSHKNEAAYFVKNYVAEVESKWNLKVHKIRSDNGGEYLNTVLKSWFEGKGIVHDVTIPYTPQFNGTAERMNRTLMEKARALILDQNSDKVLWGESVLTAAYLVNRSPTSVLDCTPAEKWYNERPNLENLQIFGCTAYAKVLGYRKKLDNRSKKYILVGYAPNGYRLYDPAEKRIIVSRDVVFSLMKVTKNDRNDIRIDEFNDEELEPVLPDDEYIDENQSIGNVYEEPIKIEMNCEFPVERSQRQRKMPSKFNDYVLMSYDEATTGVDKEKWTEAISEEINSLKRNNTWTCVDEKETNGEKILSSKWVFKIKDDGRYKARLVIRGCEQQYGINYDETFSPVVGASALRTLLAVAHNRGDKIFKFDVKTAFLYGDIDETIYMHLPEGFVGTKLCKLNRSLYGLKQAPLKWNQRLTIFLKKHGLVSLLTEKCVFKNEDGSIILAIYVDDGIVVGGDEILIKKLLDDMKNEFEIVISENPSTFLGLEIKCSSGRMKLKQESYAESVVEKFGMKQAKSAKVPMMKPDDVKAELDSSGFPYREAIGSLLYLSNQTRPDLAYAVNYSSRFMESPTVQNVKGVKHILRYLKETLGNGICYGGEIGCLDAFCDSDYAGDTETRRSTTGYVIFYCGGPIAWCSRRQPIVATSSSEAEYIAAADCVKELTYLKNFIEELLTCNVNINLNVDNQSAIQMVKSGISNRRSKHIDVKYHFINEKYNEGMFKIKYCSTDRQLADCLTKPLTETKFMNLINNVIDKN